MFPDMTKVATELNKVVVALQLNSQLLGQLREEMMALRQLIERKTHESNKEDQKLEGMQGRSVGLVSQEKRS